MRLLTEVSVGASRSERAPSTATPPSRMADSRRSRPPDGSVQRPLVAQPERNRPTMREAVNKCQTGRDAIKGFMANTVDCG